MRPRLKTALLISTLLGTMSAPIGSAHATEKVRTEAHKNKAEPVVHGSKASTVAQNGSNRTAAHKTDAIVRKGTAGAAASNSATAKVPPVARHGAVAPIAHKDRSGSRVAKSELTPVAHGGRYASAATGNGVVHAAHKRGLTRVAASSFDLWQEPVHLAVQSGSALVVPQDGGEPLYEKNANAVVPIASITKLMTAMVVLDSMPNLQAPITITDEDVDYLRGSRSRLGVGTVITRETALLLALMSSENRAANSLARHYPGGLQAFVAAMNRKAMSLGMGNSHFEDPTGLNSNNVSTAFDLARMVAAAHHYPLIREFSTTPGARAEVKGRELDFHNTNQLVSSPTWEIGLSKTGYIQEAGKCLVMQARVADKPVVIVLLDSAGKQTRIGDANRIKRWMESASATGRQPTRV